MKKFLGALTVFLVLSGFFNPVLWTAALVTGILAIGMAPEGRRSDGKRKTGGLLGGVVDDIFVKSKMRECPYCKAEIRKDAQKCSHCGEWVDDAREEEDEGRGKAWKWILGIIALIVVVNVFGVNRPGFAGGCLV